jgi:polyribonucleotide nucleotidyltransferase
MAFKYAESSVMRGLVLKEGIRADGRGVADIRPITSRANLLPRTHGSALFTRGETQVGVCAAAAGGCCAFVAPAYTSSQPFTPIPPHTTPT